MTTTKKKKSAREKRVLVASIICAAAIVAGSTFAWFTSSDEVTNRLSASADYNVTIAEDFTPPENWVPGQKVDKNVGVVNTGNVDAFVRTWLEGEMNLVNQKRDLATWGTGAFTIATALTDGTAEYDSTSTSGTISGLTDVTDEDYKAIDLTYSFKNGNDTYYLRELRQDTYLNPNNPTATVSSPDGYSDVMAVQAGGQLAYTSNANVSFKITPNQTLSFKSSAGDTYDVVGGTEYTVTIDSTVTGTADTSAATDINVGSGTIKAKDLTSLYKYLGAHIDTNTFKPCTSGLYIFRRNVALKDGEDDYEFTGYYYVAKASSDNGAEGKFFALQYENDDSQRSDYVLEEDTYTIVKNSDGTITFTPSANLYSATISGADTDLWKSGDNYYDRYGNKVDGVTPTAKSPATKAVTLFTAQKQVLSNSMLTWTYATKTLADGQEIENNGVVYTWDATNSKWTYDNAGTKTDVTADSDLDKSLDAAAAGLATLTATYYGAENKANSAGLADGYVASTATAGAGETKENPADNIVIAVNLNNVKSDVAEAWTAIAATSTTVPVTFYYNNDVEEGATTVKLVDSVELSKDTTQNAYLAFDFDLNVFMDSVQVTIDDNGKEAYESVNPWTAADVIGRDVNVGRAVPAKGAAGTYNGNEIATITWTYDSTT